VQQKKQLILFSIWLKTRSAVPYVQQQKQLILSSIWFLGRPNQMFLMHKRRKQLIISAILFLDGPHQLFLIGATEETADSGRHLVSLIAEIDHISCSLGATEETADCGRHLVVFPISGQTKSAVP
jgi:hypothetical protein